MNENRFYIAVRLNATYP